MVWQIKAFSHRCCVSTNSFEAGESYVSYLAIDDDNELQRFDVSASNDEAFTPPGQLLCCWRQVYKKEPEKDDAARKQRETAEGLFLSLYEEPAEDAEDVPAGDDGEKASAEAVIMKKFLGLMLERKRILRPRGASPDGEFRLMEHAATKTIYPVPAGELAQDELMRISDRLSSLVG